MNQPLITTGAIYGQAADSKTVAHYGAPLREQRKLLNGAALVDLNHFEILQVRGDDAPSWLTTITSQIFTDLADGGSLEMTVLSPQGRVEHLAQVVRSEDSYLFILDPDTRLALKKYFELMTFANRVELIERDDLHAVGYVQLNPHLANVFSTLKPLAIWKQSWPTVAAGGVAYGPSAQFVENWEIALFDDQELRKEIGRTLQAEHFAGFSSAEALRVTNHKPRFATEVDELSIPHELDLLRTAVHTNKGCYRGQETVAKVLNLGQPPRRLVRLHLDGSQDIPAPNGSEVYLGARKVGKITTSVMHVDEGPTALAVIKRAVPLDSELIVQFAISDQLIKLDATQVPIVVEREHLAKPTLSKFKVER